MARPPRPRSTRRTGGVRLAASLPGRVRTPGTVRGDRPLRRGCATALLWAAEGGPVRDGSPRSGASIPRCLRANQIGADPGPRLPPRQADLPRGGGRWFPALDRTSTALSTSRPATSLPPPDRGEYDNPTGATGPKPRRGPRSDAGRPCAADAAPRPGHRGHPRRPRRRGRRAPRVAVLGARRARRPGRRRIADDVRLLVLAFDADPPAGRGGSERAASTPPRAPAPARSTSCTGFGDLGDRLPARTRASFRDPPRRPPSSWRRPSPVGVRGPQPNDRAYDVAAGRVRAACGSVVRDQRRSPSSWLLPFASGLAPSRRHVLGRRRLAARPSRVASVARRAERRGPRRLPTAGHARRARAGVAVRPDRTTPGARRCTGRHVAVPSSSRPRRCRSGAWSPSPAYRARAAAPRLGVDADARFATRSRPRAPDRRRPEPGRFILGRVGRQARRHRGPTSAPAGEPPRTRRRATGARSRSIGPSRSGKTTAAIAGILEWDGPAVLASVKTDLLGATVGWRRSRARCGCSTRPASHRPAVRRRGRRSATPRRPRARSEPPGSLADAAPGGRRGRRDFWLAQSEILLFGAAVHRRRIARTGRCATSSSGSSPRTSPASSAGATSSRCCRSCSCADDPEVVAGAEEAGKALLAIWQMDERTRSSVYATAQTVVWPWADPGVGARRPTTTTSTSTGCCSGANTLYICAPIDDQKRLRSGVRRAAQRPDPPGVRAGQPHRQAARPAAAGRRSTRRATRRCGRCPSTRRPSPASGSCWSRSGSPRPSSTSPTAGPPTRSSPTT